MTTDLRIGLTRVDDANFRRIDLMSRKESVMNSLFNDHQDVAKGKICSLPTSGYEQPRYAQWSLGFAGIALVMLLRRTLQRSLKVQYDRAPPRC